MARIVFAAAVIGLGGLLAGCGIAAKVDARQDYQASELAYKDCLARNPATPLNCEGLRLAMEADERKYTNLTAGTTPGGVRANNLNVLAR